jgi:mannosyltransferase OCH1-like enzyme
MKTANTALSIMAHLMRAYESQKNVCLYNMIPFHIFQTHKSVAYVYTKPNLVTAMNSWRRHNNRFKYFFYTDEMCDRFMRDHFSGPIYEAYKKVPYAVMRADLWRYCVIYKYGGIYADIDTVCECDPALLLRYSNKQLCCAPEPGCPYFCQWTFAAPPGSQILKQIIDLSVSRILYADNTKASVHFLTGPAVFTDGIEMFLTANNIATHKHKKSYNNNPYMAIYKPDLFHERIVRHLYAGSDADGWKKESGYK